MTPLQFFLEFGFYAGVAGQVIVIMIFLYFRNKSRPSDAGPDTIDEQRKKMRKWRKW